MLKYINNILIKYTKISFQITEIQVYLKYENNFVGYSGGLISLSDTTRFKILLKRTLFRFFWNIFIKEHDASHI